MLSKGFISIFYYDTVVIISIEVLLAQKKYNNLLKKVIKRTIKTSLLRLGV